MRLPALTTAVALTALTFTLSATPSRSQTNTNQISFLCRSINPRGGWKQIPATVAFIPESGQYRQIIAWEADPFPNTVWTPQRRCEVISQRFQESYNQGRLSHLTTGSIRGLGVICATKFGETCNSNNQLFTVKPGSNPETILGQLIQIGRGRSTEAIWQTANNQRYLNFSIYLENAPVLDITE